MSVVDRHRTAGAATASAATATARRSVRPGGLRTPTLEMHGTSTHPRGTKHGLSLVARAHGKEGRGGGAPRAPPPGLVRAQPRHPVPVGRDARPDGPPPRPGKNGGRKRHRKRHGRTDRNRGRPQQNIQEAGKAEDDRTGSTTSRAGEGDGAHPGPRGSFLDTTTLRAVGGERARPTHGAGTHLLFRRAGALRSSFSATVGGSRALPYENAAAAAVPYACATTGRRVVGPTLAPSIDRRGRGPLIFPGTSCSDVRRESCSSASLCRGRSAHLLPHAPSLVSKKTVFLSSHFPRIVPTKTSRVRSQQGRRSW